MESKVTERWNLVEFGGTWWNLQILVESGGISKKCLNGGIWWNI